MMEDADMYHQKYYDAMSEQEEAQRQRQWAEILRHQTMGERDQWRELLEKEDEKDTTNDFDEDLFTL